jgi:hypothetical protein
MFRFVLFRFVFRFVPGPVIYSHLCRWLWARFQAHPLSWRKKFLCCLTTTFTYGGRLDKCNWLYY